MRYCRELSCVTRVPVCIRVTHSCVYQSLCLHICTSFEKQSLSCFKTYFSSSNDKRTHLSGDVRSWEYIYIRVFLYLYGIPPTPFYLPSACRVKISVDFFRVTRSDSLRWISWESMMLLSTLLRIAKLTTPAGPNSLFGSEKRNPPGTGRHEQSQKPNCLSSAVLLIQFALDWTLCAINLFFSMLDLFKQSYYTYPFSWYHKWNWSGSSVWPA